MGCRSVDVWLAVQQSLLLVMVQPVQHPSMLGLHSLACWHYGPSAKGVSGYAAVM